MCSGISKRKTSGTGRFYERDGRQCEAAMIIPRWPLWVESRIRLPQKQVREHSWVGSPEIRSGSFGMLVVLSYRPLAVALCPESVGVVKTSPGAPCDPKPPTVEIFSPPEDLVAGMPWHRSLKNHFQAD
jgi:hypothetical protein